MSRWIRLMVLIGLGWWWMPSVQAALSVSAHSMQSMNSAMPEMSSHHTAHQPVVATAQTDAMPMPSLQVDRMSSAGCRSHAPGETCPMQSHAGLQGDRGVHCAACISVVADLPWSTMHWSVPQISARIWPLPAARYLDFIPGIPSPPPCSSLA